MVNVVIAIAMVVVIASMICGLPIPYCFMGATMLLVGLLGYSPTSLLSFSFGITNALVLVCIPLFIAVGAIMEKGNIGEALVGFVEIFVGRVKGGLCVVAVTACALFGSISGSAAATLSCISSILFPKFMEKGYPRGHCAALMAAACPLGLFIPPSSTMILFAWVGRQSVLACFLATVGPGIMLTILLSITNLVMLRNNPDVQVTDPIPKGEFLSHVTKKTTRAFPALLMPIIILGGIYGGIFTPTEAAAVAVIYAIPVGFFVYKGLTWKGLKETMTYTASTTGVIMVMIFCVILLSRIYIMEDLPDTITGVLNSFTSNKYTILFIVNITLLVIGMVMDDTSAMLLCTPILIPVLQNFGIHPVHFGAIIGVNLGMGIITPPVAPMLYFGSRVTKTPVFGMLKPMFTFILFAWVPTLIAVTYFPQLSLWLPRLILGGKF